MSLRSVAALAILVLQLVLPLSGCTTTADKASNTTANDLERRHDEMMRRMGGGSGGGSGM